MAIRVEAVSLGRSDQTSGYVIVYLNDGRYIVRESVSFEHTDDGSAGPSNLQWLQRTQQYHPDLVQILDVTEMDDDIVALIKQHNPSIVALAVGEKPPIRKTSAGMLIVPHAHIVTLVQRLHQQKRIRVPRHQFETQEWLDQRLAAGAKGADSVWKNDGQMTALGLACWYCWYKQLTTR